MINVGVGSVFAERYRLDRLIGAGGMGSVFAAFDLRLERPVAVKILHDLHEHASRRFVREARIAAQIRSPHVVAIHDVGTEGGAGYLVQDLLTGEPLDVLLARDGPLDPPRAVRLSVQLCKALSTVHTIGIIHRDIKPSNLFLERFEDGSDRIVLIDFGIAKTLIEPTMALTTTGEIIGTPGYMAPEQARGAQIDERSDLFSLGATLFHMLTGNTPFSGEHLAAVLAKILFEEITFPKGYASPELEAVILRCIAKDPEARYPSAALLMGALLATPEGHETSDGHKPPIRQAVAREAPLDMGVTTFQPPPELCVMLVAGEPQACDPSAGTSTVTINAPVSIEDEALRRIAEKYGTKFVALTDGSLVAEFTGKEIAIDQAARAARCALALETLLPDRSIALTRGRGDIAGRVPFGEALDRAVQMLSDATGTRRIAVDEVMAGLLDAAFEVVGDALGLALRAERGVFEGRRMLLGNPTECVGRERELAILLATFTECAEKSIARVMLITGPAGIGKSRVAHEFVERLRRADAAFELWVGRCDLASDGSVLGLMAQLLRSATGAKVDEPIEDHRKKLLALAARRIDGADAVRVAEFLGEIMGSPFPDDGRVELRAARADSVLMLDQMRRAWGDLLSAECGAQPILMVIEDLHSAGLPSVQFLDAVLQRQRDQPLILLALGRPDVHERFPQLWVNCNVQELRLSGLPRKASERLVRQVLGNDTPPEVVERLIQGVGGKTRDHLPRAGPPRRDAEILKPVRAAYQDLQRYLDQAGLSLRDETRPLLAIERKPDCRLPQFRLSAILLEPEEKSLSMQTMATVVFQKQASPLYSLEGTLDEPHHVLALFRSPPGAGVYREWHELATRRHVHVSPVSPSALRAAIDNKRAAAHLLELLRRARHDPFELEGRVAVDVDFFGSREELRTLLHQVDGFGAGIGLFGLEKWGTTSLLLRFRAELGDRISAFVDLAALPSLSLASVLSAIHEDLARALRDKTQRVQPPFADIEDALRWLVEIVHTTGHARPVIFLDRTDELSRVERCTPEVLIEIARALYRLARPQTGHAGAILVFGGREDHIVASRFFGAHTNPLTGAVAIRYTPFFSREEMSDFMQRLGALCGLSFSEAALNKAFALTGGHKYLTRRLGSLLHQRQTSDAADRIEVTPDLVSACAGALVTHHHDYFDAIVERAPPALRAVLVRLAMRPAALSELLGAVTPKDSRDILAALKFADDYHLVMEKERRYRLTVGLFEDWLRLTHDPDETHERSAPPPPLPPPPAHEELQWLEERIREGFSSPSDLEMLARTLRIAPAEAMRSNVPLRVQISDLVDWAVKNRRFGDLRDAVQRERPAFFHASDGHTTVSPTGIGASVRRSRQRGQ